MEENKKEASTDTSVDTNEANNANASDVSATPAPAAAAAPIAAETSETSTPTADTPKADEQTTSATSKRNMILGFLAGLGIVFAAFMLLNSGSTTEPEAVTEISPETVVARVNGVELYGKGLQLQMEQVAEVSGLPSLDAADAATRESIKAQSLDAIINTELIVQVAQSVGVEVTDEDVEAEFARLAESVGGEEAAAARLEELGTTVEDFKKSLVNDLLIQRYMEASVDESALAVSDIEIENAYAEVASGQTENVPPLEEVRATIEQQLAFQKQQDVILSVLEKLRADSEIEILI